MRLLNTAVMPLLIALLVMGAFAVQAQESPPTFIEEGSPALDIPSDLTSPTETSALGYKITTSKDDPSCDTGFNGYVNLEDHGISVSARVPGGDNFAIGPFFTHIGPIDYYGHQYTGLYLTDDGFIVFDPVTYSNKVWNPQLIPDTTGPNGLAAVLWQDMKLVYDRAANHGVSLGAAADGSVLVVEFDDVRLANAPAHRYDIEMVMRRKVSHAPGDYEIVFAYDNLNGTLAGPLKRRGIKGTGRMGEMVGRVEVFACARQFFLQQPWQPQLLLEPGRHGLTEHRQAGGGPVEEGAENPFKLDQRLIIVANGTDPAHSSPATSNPKPPG